MRNKHVTTGRGHSPMDGTVLLLPHLHSARSLRRLHSTLWTGYLPVKSADQLNYISLLLLPHLNSTRSLRRLHSTLWTGHLPVKSAPQLNYISLLLLPHLHSTRSLMRLHSILWTRHLPVKSADQLNYLSLLLLPHQNSAPLPESPFSFPQPDQSEATPLLTLFNASPTVQQRWISTVF